MAGIDLIHDYMRFLARKNYSMHTTNNYSYTLENFLRTLNVPVDWVTQVEVREYMDDLWDRGLKPKTINCNLQRIRGFYDYLYDEEGIRMPNPVKKAYVLRLPKPLPRHLEDEKIMLFFSAIKNRRDRAMFMLMLRCGLRVEEVSNLTLAAIDLQRKQIVVYNGKWRKDRVVYISNDADHALREYLGVRPASKARRVFLAEKGPCRGKSISVRGIQKRIQHYARKTGLNVSCHQLRHTMATQLLNADARLVTVKELLGHSSIFSTQRYCTVSNLKVKRDYYKAMEVVMLGSSLERPGPG